MQQTIGLVGLGQMGAPIAARLATRFDVVAYDIDVDRRALAAQQHGVVATARLTDIARCARIVLSLPTPTISAAVVAELAPDLVAGTVIVETSTVLPDDVRSTQRAVADAGVRVVDAAILSGVAQMRDAAATLLVGGPDDAIDAVDDVLRTLGAAGVRRLGALGAGMAAKVVNNGVAHAVMVVLVEAFAMAEAEGVALEDIADMLAQPDGGVQRPLSHRIVERVASGNYDGGMPMDAARKDSTLALAMAQRSGVPLFATQAAHTAYELGIAAGMGRQDYAALAQLWERWTGRDLRFGETSDV